MTKDEIVEISPRNSESKKGKQAENESNTEKGASKFRIALSHCFALITISMFKFTHGLDSGFTTIIIPKLYKSDAEIYITRDQLTWFTSYCFMPPVGAILGGFLAQFIGCRLLLVFSALSYITSGLIFYWSENAAMLLSAQVIVGFVSGMQKGPCYTYIAEISLLQFRSFLMTTTSLIVIFGSFTSTVLGTYLHWRTVALINIAYPIVGLILICFIPESPYWLASKNRQEDAKRSLAWFRGWTSPECVEDEMRSVLKDFRSSPSRNTIERKKTSSWCCFCSNYKTSSLNRSFYIPFLTIIFVFLIANLDGVSSLNVYAVLVFEKIHSPVDPYVATIVFTGFRLLASVICMSFINLTGKRKLLFITLGSSAIALIIATLFGHLIVTDQTTTTGYRWVPMISVIIAVFSAAVGLDKISILLNSEIFPVHLRHVGVGAGNFLNTILEASMSKLFLYLVEAVTIWGTLLFFAIANIVGLIGMYFIVPETEGKSLKEIEEHYAGTKSLKIGDKSSS